MENKLDDCRAAFVTIVKEDGYEIGLAHENIKGYTPGFGKLKNMTYDEAKKHVDELNEFKFGLNKKEAAKIILSSL